MDYYKKINLVNALFIFINQVESDVTCYTKSLIYNSSIDRFLRYHIDDTDKLRVKNQEILERYNSLIKILKYKDYGELLFEDYFQNLGDIGKKTFILELANEYNINDKIVEKLIYDIFYYNPYLLTKKKYMIYMGYP